MSKQFSSIINDDDYETALARYEVVKNAAKDSPEHKEKMQLVTLIQQYEASKWDLPELDPVELNSIKNEDFYQPDSL